MTDTPRTPGRRTVRFDAPTDVLADVDRLRRLGYRQVGRWSLPQVCHHLATVMTVNLVPPPNDDPPTAEQRATKEKFFWLVLSGMPEGMPTPPVAAPPADCSDAAVDVLAAAFAAVSAYPHARQMVGRCGPVPIDEVRQLHLHHAAHHLSFLTPTTVRRSIRYQSFAELTDDVEHLRRGYVRSGNWTLPQTCWHLRTVLERLAAAPLQDPTPEMLARRPMLDAVLAGGPLPDGLPAPEALLPPPTAGEAEVDAFLALMRERQQHPSAAAMHRLFGPVTAGEVATLTLAHAAHHLSYLVPDGN